MAACGKRFGGQEEVGVEEEEDLYAVLGLNRDCSDGELRAAYKKLALRWHPDRCSAKDSKAKFQAIQEAYSVLSDSSKRIQYDFGVYDGDGDGQYTMCDFLGEMTAIMEQNKPKDNADPSFKELQALFFDMFDVGDDASASPSPTSFVDDGGSDALFDDVVEDDADGEDDFISDFSPSSSSSPPPPSLASTYSSPYYSPQPVAGSKRAAPNCDPAVAADVAAGFSDLFDSVAHAFFCGPSASESGSSTTKRAGTAAVAPTAGRGCGGAGRRAAKKQKVSLAQDVSSAAAADAVSAASF